MLEEIKVNVVELTDRKFITMQYVDPTTRRRVTKSTKVLRTGRKKERTEAERVAAKWESDLRNGRYKSPSKTTWAEFREVYENEVVAGLADNTAQKIDAVFNMVEKLLNPRMLRDLNEKEVSRYQRRMRDAGRAESTIKSHLNHLLAALSWGVEQQYLGSKPKVRTPKRAKRNKMMKGRPITGEEFERILEKTDSVVGIEQLRESSRKRAEGMRKAGRTYTEREPNATAIQLAEQRAESWRYYLRGLWLSGLRLAESLELRWDDGPMAVDLSGRRLMLRIAAEAEKGNQDRILAIAPEFAEFLLATPEGERSGYVFNPLPTGTSKRLGARCTGKMLSKIGAAAGVVVDRQGEKVKFASAHDLRRSFGERWATRIMPQVLMELMRHENIDTTMKYYVGRNAERTADVLYAAVTSNTFSNSAESAPEVDQTQKPLSPTNKGVTECG